MIAEGIPYEELYLEELPSAKDAQTQKEEIVKKKYLPEQDSYLQRRNLFRKIWKCTTQQCPIQKPIKTLRIEESTLNLAKRERSKELHTTCDKIIREYFGDSNSKNNRATVKSRFLSRNPPPVTSYPIKSVIRFRHQYKLKSIKPNSKRISARHEKSVSTSPRRSKIKRKFSPSASPICRKIRRQVSPTFPKIKRHFSPCSKIRRQFSPIRAKLKRKLSPKYTKIKRQLSPTCSKIKRQFSPSTSKIKRKLSMSRTPSKIKRSLSHLVPAYTLQRHSNNDDSLRTNASSAKRFEAGLRQDKSTYYQDFDLIAIECPEYRQSKIFSLRKVLKRKRKVFRKGRSKSTSS